MLSSVRWDHFVTLTITRENSPEGLRRLYHHGFRRVLERQIQGSMAYFVVVERGAAGRF
jgi:hypothetical protein